MRDYSGLPEPVECALIDTEQGGEYKTVSRNFEHWTAMYSADQMLDMAENAVKVFGNELTDALATTRAVQTWAIELRDELTASVETMTPRMQTLIDYIGRA